jgi:hypothetical protein
VGLIEEIVDGFHDHELRGIQEALSDRRKILASRRHRTFNIGDTVRFVGLGMGAKYMNGELAVIEDINPKTLWVRLTPESKARLAGSRFGRSSKIKVYPQHIELAYIDGVAQRPLKRIEDLKVVSVEIVNPDEVSE